MIKILFVCHGNICRSTMAQFVFQDMVNMRALASEYEIDSAATSREEIGNPPHHGTVGILQSMGVPVLSHRARQMTRADYERYDYIVGMDGWNRRNILRIVGDDPEGKVHLLLEFAGEDRDIADPWYTGDFRRTYEDVVRGCDALLAQIESERQG